MKMRSAARIMRVMATVGVLGPVSAQAAAFNDLFVFGDSYSDTGSFTEYSNGPTAVAYLAQNLGVTLTTSRNPNPGTDGVNFAQTAARITVGPTPPNLNPLSVNQQVDQFASDAASSALTFNPSSSLFFLEEGLNDAQTPLPTVTAAITSQVAQLHALGARSFELTSLPYLTGFSSSADKFDVPYVALVEQLQQAYPDTTFGLSQFGQFFDQIVANPSQYGFTNATDACVNGNQVCATPDSYFFYYGGHPSTAASRIVGEDLFQESLALPEAAATAVPEPATAALLAAGTVCLLLLRRKRQLL